MPKPSERTVDLLPSEEFANPQQMLKEKLNLNVFGSKNFSKQLSPSM